MSDVDEEGLCFVFASLGILLGVRASMRVGKSHFQGTISVGCGRQIAMTVTMKLPRSLQLMVPLAVAVVLSLALLESATDGYDTDTDAEYETTTAATTTTTNTTPPSSQQPHIIFIVLDDLGSYDLGLHGSGIETPVIDDLATSEGVFLENYYTFSHCYPTRVAFMTGRYPFNPNPDELKRKPKVMRPDDEPCRSSCRGPGTRRTQVR